MNSVKSLSPQEANLLIKEDKSIILIDVRENDEYQFCKIEGAKLLPLSNFVEEIQKANIDKSSKLIIYCHHGKRSLRASDYLLSEGYCDVSNLEGGIDLWSLEIDQSIPRY